MSFQLRSHLHAGAGRPGRARPWTLSWPMPALLVAALLPLLAACVSMTPVLETPDLQVYRLSGLRPEAPPDPGLPPLTQEQFATSLSRIQIRFGKSTLFFPEAPEPLLSPAQVQRMADILVQQFPGLGPEEGLRFRFRDAKRGLAVQMDVTLEGRALVYRFDELLRESGPNATPDDINRALIAPLPGQQGGSASTSAWLRDTVDPTELAAVRELEPILAIMARLEREELLTPEQAVDLRGLVADHPGVPVTRWQAYLERRETLEKAKRDGLVDAEVYAARLEDYQRTLLGGG